MFIKIFLSVFIALIANTNVESAITWFTDTCPKIFCNYNGLRLESNNILSIKDFPTQEKDSLLKYYTALGLQNVDSLIEVDLKNIESELKRCKETNTNRFDKRLEK